MPRPESSLIEPVQTAAPICSMRGRPSAPGARLNFIRACTGRAHGAAIPTDRIGGRRVPRRARRGIGLIRAHLDLAAARAHVAAYVYLRPLLFTAKDACLFDSLAMVRLPRALRHVSDLGVRGADGPVRRALLGSARWRRVQRHARTRSALHADPRGLTARRTAVFRYVAFAWNDADPTAQRGGAAAHRACAVRARRSGARRLASGGSRCSALACAPARASLTFCRMMRAWCSASSSAARRTALRAARRLRSANRNPQGSSARVGGISSTDTGAATSLSCAMARRAAAGCCGIRAPCCLVFSIDFSGVHVFFSCDGGCGAPRLSPISRSTGSTSRPRLPASDCS